MRRKVLLGLAIGLTSSSLFASTFQLYEPCQRPFYILLGTGYLAKSIFKLFPAYFTADTNKVREEEILDKKNVLIASLRTKVAKHFAPQPVSAPVISLTQLASGAVNTGRSYVTWALHGLQNAGNAALEKIGEAANPTNNVGI